MHEQRGVASGRARLERAPQPQQATAVVCAVVCAVACAVVERCGVERGEGWAEVRQPLALRLGGGGQLLHDSAKHRAAERHPRAHDGAQGDRRVGVLELARRHLQPERGDDLVPLRLVGLDEHRGVDVPERLQHELHEHWLELAVGVAAHDPLLLGLEEVLAPERLLQHGLPHAELGRV